MKMQNESRQVGWSRSYRQIHLAGAKKHPKTQHTRKHRQSTIPNICDFGCVAFSGAFWRPLRGEQRAPENATHPKTQILGTIDYLRFRVCCVFGCSLLPSDILLLSGGNCAVAKLLGDKAATQSSMELYDECLSGLLRVPILGAILGANFWSPP